MKFKFIIIGIMLALVVCITPVAAVLADDFVIYIDEVDGKPVTYTYFNQKNLYDEYTVIYAYGTVWKHSLVTFKAANIEGAPVMVVDTYCKEAYIYLPRSVDEWEIKYYHGDSYNLAISYLDDKYLKNAGVVNLNKVFGNHVKDGLWLEIFYGLRIESLNNPSPIYRIPEVKIPPVVPVSADLFEVDIVDVDGHDVYDYRNVIDPNDGTFWIWTGGTHWLNSYVTFKPVGIKGAPVMVVDTSRKTSITLPQCVDEWEIKYYSSTEPLSQPDRDYLKNAGVVNLKQFFGDETVFDLDLSKNQTIHSRHNQSGPTYVIPEVKK